MVVEAHASIDQNRLCDQSISVFDAQGSLIDDYYSHLCRTIDGVAEENEWSHACLSLSIVFSRFTLDNSSSRAGSRVPDGIFDWRLER